MAGAVTGPVGCVTVGTGLAVWALAFEADCPCAAGAQLDEAVPAGAARDRAVRQRAGASAGARMYI